MGIIFTICIILSSSIAYGQIESISDFIDFGLADNHEQAVMIGSDWIPIESESNSENYWRYYEEEKYLLTVKEVYNKEVGANYRVATVNFNRYEIFKEWKNDLYNLGINIVQAPSNNNKWVVMDEDDYIIYMQKRQVKDIWIYEISVLVETNLGSLSKETSKASILNNNSEVMDSQGHNSIFLNKSPEDKSRNSGIGNNESFERIKRNLTKLIDTTGLVVVEKCKLVYDITIDSQGNVRNCRIVNYIAGTEEETLNKKQLKRKEKAKQKLIEELKNRIYYKLKFESEIKRSNEYYMLTIDITVNPTKYNFNYIKLR